MLKNKFIDKSKKLEKNLNTQNIFFKIIGNIKLILFVFSIFTLYQIFTSKSLFSIIFFSTYFILLIIFSIIQIKVKNKIKYYISLININNKYIDRIELKFDNFENISQNFMPNSHDFAKDLDILGKNSLFSYINIANSSIGIRNLIKNLLNLDFNKDEINKRKEAIKELSKKIDFMQNLEYYTSKIQDDKNIDNIIESLTCNNYFTNNYKFEKFIKIYPIIANLFILIITIFNIKQFFLVIYCILLFNFILFAIKYKKSCDFIYKIDSYYVKFGDFKEIFKNISKEKFDSTLLKNIISSFSSNNFSAVCAIKKMDTIMQKLSLKHNTVIYFLFNILFLWDFNCCIDIQNWKKKYKEHIKSWFYNLGHLETLASFSVLEHTLEKFCYPSIEDNFIIKVKNMGHLLIKNQKRVYNDFILNNDIVILSGSNMSGKTTFLRSIGINLVLAYNGGPVCADEFICPKLKIVTSMRVSDNLSEGLSTFYSELLQIKNIIDNLNSNIKILFLIDEIFRGTNSYDRLVGAKRVIEKLYQKNAIGFITTHDIELCESFKKSKIKNYNFSEKYIDDKIFFDYKIKEGISETSNAKYLMKMLGILEKNN